jgi:hypothetical protein
MSDMIRWGVTVPPESGVLVAANGFERSNVSDTRQMAGVYRVHNRDRRP